MKLAIACAGLFAFAVSACSTWAATTPVDVCKGPITYVEIATAGGKYPTDTITPDAGTDDFPIWSSALKLNSSKSVYCTANPGDADVINPLPANVTSCKLVAATVAGKKTMLCE